MNGGQAKSMESKGNSQVRLCVLGVRDDLLTMVLGNYVKLN